MGQLEAQLDESKELITQQHQPFVATNKRVFSYKKAAKNTDFQEEIRKLKQKNGKLEARLIAARSEKAKMLPGLLREKTALHEELCQMKIQLALYIVRWKFIEKKYQKQQRDLNADLERYQRKLDIQIKGKRKMGNQMERLDKMAQNTLKT